MGPARCQPNTRIGHACSRQQKEKQPIMYNVDAHLKKKEDHRKEERNTNTHYVRAHGSPNRGKSLHKKKPETKEQGTNTRERETMWETAHCAPKSQKEKTNETRTSVIRKKQQEQKIYIRLHNSCKKNNITKPGNPNTVNPTCGAGM